MKMFILFIFACHLGLAYSSENTLLIADAIRQSSNNESKLNQCSKGYFSEESLISIEDHVAKWLDLSLEGEQIWELNGELLFLLISRSIGTCLRGDLRIKNVETLAIKSTYNFLQSINPSGNWVLPIVFRPIAVHFRNNRAKRRIFSIQGLDQIVE